VLEERLRAIERRCDQLLGSLAVIKVQKRGLELHINRLDMRIDRLQTSTHAKLKSLGRDIKTSAEANVRKSREVAREEILKVGVVHVPTSTDPAAEEPPVADSGSLEQDAAQAESPVQALAVSDDPANDESDVEIVEGPFGQIIHRPVDREPAASEPVEAEEGGAGTDDEGGDDQQSQFGGDRDVKPAGEAAPSDDVALPEQKEALPETAPAQAEAAGDGEVDANAPTPILVDQDAEAVPPAREAVLEGGSSFTTFVGT